MIKNLNNILFALSTCTVMSLVSTPAFSVDGPYTRCITLLANDIADTLLETTNINDDKFVIQANGDTVENNDRIIFGSDMFVEFFVKHIDDCRDYLLSRESPDKDIYVDDPDLHIDIRWDYLIDEITAALTTNANQRQLFVCENNRGWQAGIDGALWAGTVIASIYSFGSASVAATGARTAVTQGAKNVVKVGVKQGGKVTAKEAAISATAEKLGMKLAEKEAAATAAKVAQKTIAKQEAATIAYKEAETAVTRNALISSTRKQLQGGSTKRISDAAVRKELEKQMGGATANKTAIQDAINLLDDKAAKKVARTAANKAVTTEIRAANATADATIAEYTAEHAAAQTALNKALATFAVSTPIAALGGMASVYSYLQSDLNTQVMNCKKTKANSGCYLSCNKDILSAPTDDLNKKVFKPILGANLCIDEETNFVLRQIDDNGLPTVGDVFITTSDKWEKVKQKIAQDVANQGNCDWKINDVDMYVATPLYDPETLEPAEDGATGLLIDAVRIDD